jgi:hypothetical protein
MNDNYIKFKNAKQGVNRFIAHSSNPFFYSEIIVKINEDSIVFTKPTIDYSGKTIKPTKTNKKYKWVTFSLYAENMKEGKYIISEENNEDIIVIYFTDEQIQ